MRKETFYQRQGDVFAGRIICPCKFPDVWIVPRARQITAPQMIKLEDLWKDNVDAEFQVS